MVDETDELELGERVRREFFFQVVMALFPAEEFITSLTAGGDAE